MAIPTSRRFQGASILSRVWGRQDSKTEIHYEKDISGEVVDIVPDLDLRLLWVVRGNDYKYVQFASEKTRPFLFDLRNDPGEYQTLANDPAHMSTIPVY